MNTPLPADSVVPDPNDVRSELAALGFGHVDVWVHAEMGCMVEPEKVPDAVWLTALRKAGARPLPCVACYTAGEGADCISGRCHRPNAAPTGLILPPSFGR